MRQPYIESATALSDNMDPGTNYSPAVMCFFNGGFPLFSNFQLIPTYLFVDTMCRYCHR